MSTQDDKKLIKENTYLVFDTEGKVYPVFHDIFDQYRVSKNHIFFVNDPDKLNETLRVKKPNFFIYMYDDEKRNVLDSIDIHKEINPNALQRAIIVLSNSRKLNSFALSLEGDIDCFIVEPFGEEKLATKLKKVIKDKLNPSDYQLLITSIEQLIIQGHYEEAKQKCNVAGLLHPRPASSEYLHGLAYFKENNFEEAVKHLIKGLQFNKDHYRCLLLLHDTYVNMGDYDRAFEVLKKTTEKYPLGNKRSLDLLKHGISLGKFREIEKYATNILESDSGNEELYFFCSSCLVICAKNAKDENIAHAHNLVHRAFQHHNRSTKVLRHVFKVAVDLNMPDIYNKILKAFREKSGPDFEYCRLSYQLMETPNLTSKIDKFEEDIEKLDYDPDYYYQLVNLCKNQLPEEDLTRLKKLGHKYGLINE